MKTKNTIILIFILSNISVFSQSVNKEEVVSKKMSSSNVVAKNIKAFQLKSENKITDFYSYLNILGNKKVENEMKLHTINEIKKLFKDENISIPDFLNNKEKEIKLVDFLNQIANSNQNIVFEATNFQESISMGFDGTYSWTIGYTLNITKEKSNLTIKNVMQNASVVQEEKAFGKKSKTVLTTYLSGIWMK